MPGQARRLYGTDAQRTPAARATSVALLAASLSGSRGAMTIAKDDAGADAYAPGRRGAKARRWPIVLPMRALLYVAHGALVLCNRVARALRLVPRALLLIPPAAPGSLGDEAMVVATVGAMRTRFAGRIGIVRYRRTTDFPVQVDSTFDLSRYFEQGGARGEELRLLWTLLGYSNVALLGADVLDGFYSDDAVRLRLRLVAVAARAGAQTSVLGFSCNERPTPRAEALIRALPASVRLFARDALSQARLSAIAASAVERAADTAFLLQPDKANPQVQALAHWAAGVHRSKGRVLGVNLSAVAMEEAGLSPDAALAVAHEALERLLAARPATRLVLVPHDMRGGDSDVDMLRRLALRLAAIQPDMRMLELPLPASAIKAACASMDLVWTGRMHLAIAAIGQGTPAVAHEYQGKFAGLFTDTKLEALLFPRDRLPTGAAIADLLIESLDRCEALHDSIMERLPALTALAQRNIDANAP
ncbi:MAG: polysaccharide pyruvyl transferase family protein [Casimicrobiaceae bacterium]